MLIYFNFWLELKCFCRFLPTELFHSIPKCFVVVFVAWSIYLLLDYYFLHLSLWVLKKPFLRKWQFEISRLFMSLSCRNPSFLSSTSTTSSFLQSFPPLQRPFSMTFAMLTKDILKKSGHLGNCFYYFNIISRVYST